MKIKQTPELKPVRLFGLLLVISAIYVPVNLTACNNKTTDTPKKEISQLFSKKQKELSKQFLDAVKNKEETLERFEKNKYEIQQNKLIKELSQEFDKKFADIIRNKKGAETLERLENNKRKIQQNKFDKKIAAIVKKLDKLEIKTPYYPRSNEHYIPQLEALDNQLLGKLDAPQKNVVKNNEATKTIHKYIEIDNAKIVAWLKKHGSNLLIKNEKRLKKEKKIKAPSKDVQSFDTLEATKELIERREKERPEKTLREIKEELDKILGINILEKIKKTDKEFADTIKRLNELETDKEFADRIKRLDELKKEKNKFPPKKKKIGKIKLSLKEQTKLNKQFLDAVKNNEEIETIKALIKKGADVNAQDYRGRTALHKYSEVDNAEMVEWLIKHGANRLIKDKSGEIAKIFITSKEDKEELPEPSKNL